MKNSSKTNTKVIDKMLTMAELIDLMHANGVSIASTKNNSQTYRILRGATSIHIKKNGYLAYVTEDDFAALEGAALDGIKLELGTNSTDKKRPNIARVSKEAIEGFIKVLAQNVDNQFA